MRPEDDAPASAPAIEPPVVAPSAPAMSPSGAEMASPAVEPSTVAARTLRIGITGPIGCGKSTVAAWLGELGAVVIDADRVARQVTGPGEPAVAEIAAAFGPQLVLEDGSLDRAALGRIVFADPEALLALEAIIHPAVRPVILEEIAAAERVAAPAVVIEAIKLVEGGLAELCDEVWLIVCAADAQLARVRARMASTGQDPADAEARIDAQAGMVGRLAPVATRILDTSGDFAATRSEIERAYSLALSAGPTGR